MRRDIKLKDLQIIVMDLDGTLLDGNGEIGKESKRLIKELKQKNVSFTFASGRLHSALINIARELDITLPLISLDGCLIKDESDNSIISQSFVPVRHVKKALKLADKYLLNVALCHPNAIYYTETNSVIPRIVDKFGACYEEVNSYDEYLNETLEVAFASDYKENLQKVLKKMRFPHTFGLSESFFKSMTHPGIYYLEIRKYGANKAKALLKLLKKLNIHPKNSAVIGDWYNDYSLFQTPAYKVTLANGVAEIKRMADFITKRDNNEDGVAEFLEEVLKAKSS